MDGLCVCGIDIAKCRSREQLFRSFMHVMQEVKILRSSDYSEVPPAREAGGKNQL
jgi:hypothetical protein